MSASGRITSALHRIADVSGSRVRGLLVTQSGHTEEVNRALDAVGEHDVLVVWKLDRIGRSLFLSEINGSERPLSICTDCQSMTIWITRGIPSVVGTGCGNVVVSSLLDYLPI